MADQTAGLDVGRMYAWEHDKLGQVQRLLADSFAKVQGIMQKYNEERYKDVIADFGQQFAAFQQSVTQVLTAQVPQGLRDPFQEVAALQVERQQGYDKLSEMNDEIQRLKDQHATQNKLIEELQSSSKNTTRVSTFSEADPNRANDEDPPYSDPLHFDDPQDTIVQLTNELETAQMNVGQLRRHADELTNQNKSLSVEVLSLRDQANQSYNPNLNANNLFNNGSHANTNTNEQTQNQSEIQGLNGVIEQLRIENGSLKEETKMASAKIEDLKRRLQGLGGQTKHLFRSDTVTDWDANSLDALKKEMNKHKLALMTGRQMNIADGDTPIMDSINEDGANGQAADKKLFRENTTANWNPDDLAQLTDDLMSELHDQKRKALSEQLDKQMRYPEERRPTNLIQGSNDSGILSVDEMQARHDAMKDALIKEKKQVIMAQTEKSMALREVQETQGMLQLDEFNEAMQQLEALKVIEGKNKLRQMIAKQEEIIVPVAEPTSEQYQELDRYLKNELGLLNENIRERTINGLKNVFSERGGTDKNVGNNSNHDSNAVSDNDGNTPYGNGYTNNNVTGSLLDDHENDVDILYPTPGGPTQGGPDETPGGPNETPGGPAVAHDNEWQQIAEDQTKRIDALTKAVNNKNNEINQLRYSIGLLESEINALKLDNRNNESGNGDSGNSRNDYDREPENDKTREDNANEMANSNGDGMNQLRNEINELRRQVSDLKDMKLQLIDTTSNEMNHLRTMIRDMQQKMNGGAEL